MTEPLSLQGRWWLPENEDHRVFGTLTWNADNGGVLHLQDELQPVVWLDNVLADGSVQKYRSDESKKQAAYPVILGRVEHRAYTLLDSFRLSVREYDMEERVERVHVNRLLAGAWFDDPQELRVDRVSIDICHLTGWVDHSGLDVAWPRAEGEETDQFAIITAKSLPPFKTECGGHSIQITQGLGTAGDFIHNFGVTQRWSLRIHTPKTEPLDTFLEIASDLQDLLSVAVGSTAQFETVVLHHPNLPALSLAGTPIGNQRHDVRYYARWSNRSGIGEPIKSHNMYFTFDDLGGIDGVGRWLAAAADYRTELGRVMATRYNKGMVLEDRIMNVSAALDSLDKHRRGTGKMKVTYAQRVQHCVDLAGQPFLDLIGTGIERWTQMVVNTRNDLAHHRERFRTEGGIGNHLLAEQLFWLFIICMLRIADAHRTVYERISRHADIRWLTEQARGAGEQSQGAD